MVGAWDWAAVQSVTVVGRMRNKDSRTSPISQDDRPDMGSGSGQELAHANMSRDKESKRISPQGGSYKATDGTTKNEETCFICPTRQLSPVGWCALQMLNRAHTHKWVFTKIDVQVLI